MPVYFSYHSDTILAVLSIFLFMAGTTCIALSRERVIARPVPSWRHFGAAMIIMAAREWLGIFGIADPDFVSWYPLAALMQVLASLFILAAARGEAEGDRRRVAFIHAATAVFLIAGVRALATPFLTHGQPDQSLISAVNFFLIKGSAFAAAMVFVYCVWRKPNPPQAGVAAIPALFALMALLVFICLPPGIPSGPDRIVPWVNAAVLAFFLLRAALALAMALLLWNAYAKALGVMGQNRWWPLLIMLFMVSMSVAFIVISSENYRGMVRRNLLSAAKDAAVSIPGDVVLAAAAAKGLANDPAVARGLFQRVRELDFLSGHTGIDIHVDVLAFPPGGEAAVPLIDAAHHPDGGRWAGGDLGRLRDEALEKGAAFLEQGLEPVLVLAALPERDGASPGAAVLSVSPFELALDLYKFKFILLALLPPSLLLLMLIVSGQQRDWLNRHSVLKFEAVRLGALGSDLTGVIITRGSTVLDMNQRCSIILGAAKDELIGRRGEEILPALEAARLKLEASGDADATTSFETVATRAGGGSVDLLVLGRRLPAAPDGVYYLWECVDVTSLKSLENEIRTARDHLQMIVDSLPVGVFVKDSHGRYTLVNKTFAALFGFGEAADAIGKTGDALCGADSGFIRAHDEICVDMQGATLAYDQKFDFPGGERYYEISKTMKWHADDRANYVIVGSVHDFTSRQKAQDAIQAERHFLKQLIDTLPVSVCFMDRDQIIRLCDTDFCAEAGAADPSELIGKRYQDVLPYGRFPPEEDARLLASGGGFEDVEFELDKNGRKRHFILRSIVMSSTAGEAVGLVKAFRDTTALVAASRAAKKADRARAAFLANMSHELRTPMNGIVGMADLVIDHTAKPMLRLYGEIIIKSAKTLQMVMDEVMDTATVEDEAERLVLAPAPFSLLNVAEEAAKIVSCIIEAWGVELSFHYDFAMHGVHLGDARQIRQIMTQILTHCSRSASDRRLRLEISPDGPDAADGVRLDALFRPADDMTPDRLEAMFKPPANADAGGVLNLGMFNHRIGLPLAWRLIEAMGGSLAVTESEGTIRCRVRLPLPSADKDAPDLAAAPPDLSGVRVVTATPDAVRARSIRSPLDSAGALTTGAATRAEVGRLLGDGGCDLLILDANLVEPSELADLLAEASAVPPPSRPAVILVVSSREVQSLGDVGMHIHSILVPPVCPSELWAKALAAVGRRPAPAAPEGTADAPPPLAPAPAAPEVLLVEDNPVNQMVAMGILKRLGCRAALAKNGEEAVRRLANGEIYDIVFMDCMMPVMDGYEATSRIRLHEKNVPGTRRNVIIALTANTVAGDKEKCLAAGMDDYVTKPVTLELMRAAMLRHPPLRGGKDA